MNYWNYFDQPLLNCIDSISSPTRYLQVVPAIQQRPQRCANMYMAEVDKYSRGIVRDRNRLYCEDFKQMTTPYPPPDEQGCIVRNLNKTTHHIDTAIDRSHREIPLLREYRTRLIADVVAGKIDVREDVHRES